MVFVTVSRKRMPTLTIELTKLPQNGALLRCVLPDGSVTSQRNEGQRGRFFALHDLRHYAVESVLRHTRGFYGLLAAGWEIEDTTGKGARGKLPEETIAVEHLVGMLDADVTNGGESSAADFNRYAAEFATRNNCAVPSPLSEESLIRIRELESELYAQWIALSEGKTLKLMFQ